MKILSKYTTALSILILLLISILFRFNRNNLRAPFWTDEYSSAKQAMLISQRGFVLFDNSNQYFEPNNLVTHIIIAISFSLFGISETTARLPSLMVGSLVPVLIFLITKKRIGQSAAFMAGLLAACSYMQIVWSLQARSYMLLQVFSLMAIYQYLSLQEGFKLKKLITFLVISIFGLFTHYFFALTLLGFMLHSFLFNRRLIVNLVKSPFSYMFIAIVSVLLFSVHADRLLLDALYGEYFNFRNNFWYYHSLLWRVNSSLVILSVFGYIADRKSKKFSELLILIAVVHLIFISFFFGHYMSKYVLPIYFTLLIGAALGLKHLASQLKSYLNKNNVQLAWLTIILGVIYIFNGNNFVFHTKQFYSVNHNFRDLALVDYHQLYSLIHERVRLHKNVAVIETLPDRAWWYLGIDYPSVFWFRWDNAGFQKTTSYYVNERGEKVVINAEIPLISEVADLTQVVKEYKYGFIWIDDSSLPSDVISYVNDNFKQELYLEHYPLDDNPYSIWPGTLYSWGFDDE